MIVGYVKKSSSKGSCFTEKMLTESDLVTPSLSSNTLACTLKQALSKSFRAPAAASLSATPLAAGNSMGVDVIDAEVLVSGDSLLPGKWV